MRNTEIGARIEGLEGKEKGRDIRKYPLVALLLEREVL